MRHVTPEPKPNQSIKYWTTTLIYLKYKVGHSPNLTTQAIKSLKA